MLAPQGLPYTLKQGSPIAIAMCKATVYKEIEMEKAAAPGDAATVKRIALTSADHTEESMENPA